jgi:acetylornithine deacetylase/succinyl-diaminopimelate desuccinylase-like protein
MSLERIHQYIDDHFDETVKEIQRFISQPGFSHTGEGIRETAEMCREYVAALGATDAQLVETDGNPVVFGTVRSSNPEAKTLVGYSLYDVVPVKEEEWTFPPLAAEIVDATEAGLPENFGKVMVGRGTHNQRGPMLAFVKVLEAIQSITSDLPVNVMFAWEGEEEIGCPHLHQFIEKKLAELSQADAVYMPSMREDENGTVIFNRGYKGKLNVEIEIEGGEWGGRLDGRDLWSANTAWVDAPMHQMIRLLGTLFDEDQRPSIDGFYENVRAYTEEEIDNLRVMKESFDEEQIKRSLNIRRFKQGKPGAELLEDYYLGPMLNVGGIVGGYMGPQVFTLQGQRIVAKIDMRLVPNQRSEEVLQKLRMHLDDHGFPHAKLRVFGRYEWSRTSATEGIYQAALAVVERRGKPYQIWPTTPAVGPFGYFNQDPLHLPCIFVGTGHGWRAHQADEYITIDGLRENMHFVADFIHEWAGMGPS